MRNGRRRLAFDLISVLSAIVLSAFALTAQVARAEAPLPPTVEAIRDLAYAGEAGPKLDVYFPKVAAASGLALPTVVWIHGGGWAGGSKDYVAAYAAALASCGYTVAALDYALPPAATYPTPVREAFAALAYLRREATRLHVDPARFVIAGDSAGAQMAAQVANAATSRRYARLLGVTPTISRKDLRGALLFSGAFDLQTMRFDRPITEHLGGPLADYAGTTQFRTDRRFSTFSVARYLTPRFPPPFVTAGNADDFEDQSRDFVKRLEAKGVKVDALFFPAGFTPPTPHVYQFAMDTPGGKLAFARMLLFLAQAAVPR